MGDEQVRRPRYAIVDMVRGLAIIGVIIYHFAWDLRYFEFIGAAVETDPFWFAFARSLLGSFMLLTGVSLYLAHGNGVRWKPFWRRFLVIVLAALAITLGTYIFFPDAFVYFGVLHAIALCSLLALPFVRAPLWLVIGVALVVFIAPAFYASDIFTAKYLSWIGFWTEPPFTNDLVPLFPWFGVVLFGIALTRIVLATPLRPKLEAIAPRTFVGRFFAKAGRWSLPIYLVHQPLWLAVLFPLSMLMQPGAALREADFVQSCQRSCEIGAGEQGFCQRYCSCSAEQIAEGDLWEALTSDPPSAEQQRSISSVTRLCSAMAKEDGAD